jgi:hypothetical protein
MFAPILPDLGAALNFAKLPCSLLTNRDLTRERRRV